MIRQPIQEARARIAELERESSLLAATVATLQREVAVLEVLVEEWGSDAFCASLWYSQYDTAEEHEKHRLEWLKKGRAEAEAAVAVRERGASA